MWDANAKLCWFDKIHGPSVDAAGYDAAIVELGTENIYADKQLDCVYRAGKPTIGFFSWGFDYVYNMSFNPSAWYKPDDDVYMGILDRALFSGSIQRKYSALIIDVSNTLQVQNIHMAPLWMRDFAFEHVRNMVAKRYGLKVYMYMTPSAYSRYRGTELTQYFQGLPADNGLSTVSISAVDANGRPTDDNGPMKDNSNQLTMDCGYWFFWLFRVSPRLEWLYKFAPAQLYKDIAWTAPIIPGPVDPGDPDPGIPNESLLSLHAKIDNLTTLYLRNHKERK